MLTETGIVRSDITSSFGDASGVADGIPVTVKLKVYDLNGDAATPLVGAAVYLWHCDRDGSYSMYSDAAADENYLRGVQETAADGSLQFTTIFPACYSGRWPHMHFEVYESLDAATSASNKLRTSQLALPQDVCETVYATSGYEQSRGEPGPDQPRQRHGLRRRLLPADGPGHRLGRRGVRRVAQHPRLTPV